jgi:translocation and assembly module TamA
LQRLPEAYEQRLKYLAAHKLSRIAGLAIAIAAMVTSPAARAADPQPYTVTIATTNEGSLDAALAEASQLRSLRESAPAGPFALIDRARLDTDRLQTVLESFGYYQGQVSITVNGRSLDDPELLDVIAAVPEGRVAIVAIAVAPGRLYHLRKIAIDGEVSASERATLRLEPGVPASAAAILDARARLLSALQEDGYAFARVDMPAADEDPAEFVLDVTFHVSPGAVVAIGPITIMGLKRVEESVVRRRLVLRSGDRYSRSSLEKARRDLLALGVFTSVTTKTGEEPDESGRVPVKIIVQERLRHSISFNTAYSSDLGGSAGVKWSDRDVFGGAEQLNLAASVIELGGHATTGVGYNISAQFIKPGSGERDQNLQFNVATLKQSLQAYDQTAETASALVVHRFTASLTASIGVSGEREQITQEGAIRDYTLMGLPVNAKYNSTGLVNPLEDPLHGVRASVSITPTRSFSGVSATFFVAQADAATYLDLASLGWTAAGHSVLAVRALVGQAHGAAPFDLPPDQRFYGGGSSTVRGFRYQSVGPKFADGTPTGGTAVDAATLEFRQRIGSHFGGAIFVDAGAVSGEGHPLEGRPSVGTGIGMRYYTPIGPIRLDVAVPVTRLLGGDHFEVYIGLGQAF